MATTQNGLVAAEQASGVSADNARVVSSTAARSRNRAVEMTASSGVSDIDARTMPYCQHMMPEIPMQALCAVGRPLLYAMHNGFG